VIDPRYVYKAECGCRLLDARAHVGRVGERALVKYGAPEYREFQILIAG
jgi:hypothetical protein